MQREVGLPEAEFWRGDECGIDAILMVEVDGLEDSNLLLFIIPSANMGEEIVLAGKTCDESQPLTGQMKIDTLAH